MRHRPLGQRLAELRKTRGMSRYALAKQAQGSREYITKLEEGSSDPTVGMVRRIAKALGVGTTELLMRRSGMRWRDKKSLLYVGENKNNLSNRSSKGYV